MRRISPVTTVLPDRAPWGTPRTFPRTPTKLTRRYATKGLSHAAISLSGTGLMSPNDIIRYLISSRLFERSEVLAMSALELYLTLDYVSGKRPKGWRPIG